MNVVKKLLYIYLILKPYYLFKSGGLQICDIFLLVAFFLLFTVNKKGTENEFKENTGFVIFVLFTIIINGIYFVIFNKAKFLVSSLYFIFNMMGIIVFGACFDNKIFLIKIKKIICFNLIIQLIVFLLGLGRFYGKTRYEGTFNDPNQFAYYIFISYMFIFFISKIIEKKIFFDCLMFFITVFLIFESASTGMLLGILTFFIIQCLYSVKHIIGILNRNKIKIIMGGVIFSILILLYFLIIPFEESVVNIIINSNLINRLDEKIGRLDKREDVSPTLFEERGYDKIYNYPYVILYGSGEGEYQRFQAYHTDEIHATFPSILFYYGIGPFMVLLRWIYIRLKGMPMQIYIMYIAVFIESFTLLNQRQLLFWILIVLAGTYKKNDYYKGEKEYVR